MKIYSHFAPSQTNVNEKAFSNLLQVYIFYPKLRTVSSETFTSKPTCNSKKIQMPGPLNLLSAMLEYSLVHHKVS